MDLKNFYNHINMCLNAVTIIQEDLLHSYQYIKNTLSLKNTLTQIVITLHIIGMYRHTLPLCTHSPQYYKVVNTHAHELLGWTILSRLLHALAPHLVGVNGDVQSDLATLAIKNVEKLNIFIV